MSIEYKDNNNEVIITGAGMTGPHSTDPGAPGSILDETSGCVDSTEWDPQPSPMHHASHSYKVGHSK